MTKPSKSEGSIVSRPRAVINRPQRAAEHHKNERTGWLRAAVLGANDGILSTASLVMGVAAAGADHRTLLLAGASGLVAGAMSMAAGEFVSVHSQQDSENADLARESLELKQDPVGEQRELAGIYVGRGVNPHLAKQVAAELMARDALGAHARDELGFSPTTTARPTQAALASAASFSVGGALPIGVVLAASPALLIFAVPVASLLFLAGLGAVSAWIGGAPVWPGTWRVALWGALAMGVTAGAGALLGSVA